MDKKHTRIIEKDTISRPKIGLSIEEVIPS